MTGCMRIVAALLVLGLGSAHSSASGCLGPWNGSYYGPPLMIYDPYLSIMPPMTYAPAARPTAKPMPQAPMPQSPEPINVDPIRRAPRVNEARTHNGEHTANKAVSPTGRIRVGFWNVTGRDVQLTIDGQPRTLPRDRAITLELDREFAWQADQGKTRQERIPAGKESHEIILRD